MCRNNFDQLHSCKCFRSNGQHNHRERKKRLWGFGSHHSNLWHEPTAAAGCHTYPNSDAYADRHSFTYPDCEANNQADRQTNANRDSKADTYCDGHRIAYRLGFTNSDANQHPGAAAAFGGTDFSTASNRSGLYSA
jgi:hypothetical protein